MVRDVQHKAGSPPVAAVPDFKHWSQSAALIVKSGYSEGPIQFGLDGSVAYAHRLLENEISC